MELAAWITLAGVLVAGLVCLRLCRRILTSGTNGPERRAAAGSHHLVCTFHRSSGAYCSADSTPCSGCVRIRGASKRAARSPGLAGGR